VVARQAVVCMVAAIPKMVAAIPEIPLGAHLRRQKK
jgi:hypothetical protein